MNSKLAHLSSYLLGASALGAEMTPELKALAEAASKEGRLNLSWSQSSLGGSQGELVRGALDKGLEGVARIQPHCHSFAGAAFQGGGIRWLVK